jgi:uncharacterized repeat protein (TIGR03803 family)
MKSILLKLLLLSAAAGLSSQSQTLTTLVRFNGANGSDPVSALVQGIDGNFYGTTFSGGAYNYGTVFRVTPEGRATTLHSFDLTDGANPQAALVQGTDGNFYGTTSDLSVSLGCCSYSNDGTVFKITPEGVLTTLHTFMWTDGANPMASLVQGTDGDFYGTTPNGGLFNFSDGGGTVFKITSQGVFTRLYRFNSRSYSPQNALIQATNGNFYGTTEGGTIYEITPAGAFTQLYLFPINESYDPMGGLIQASNGNFYGTTSGNSKIFEITPAGVLTTLYSFDTTEGQTTYAGLVQATDGNFYGTTWNGGSNYLGTLFEITPSGVFTTLENFLGTNGNQPAAPLIQGTDGNFYGTTSSGGGGANGGGTVFSLSTSLGPLVKMLPPAGATGSVIRILGTNLIGATGVTFNGIAAPFTVVSASEITATVPAGATTGPVQVTTPSFTLLSNVAFLVNP